MDEEKIDFLELMVELEHMVIKSSSNKTIVSNLLSDASLHVSYVLLRSDLVSPVLFVEIS